MLNETRATEEVSNFPIYSDHSKMGLRMPKEQIEKALEAAVQKNAENTLLSILTFKKSIQEWQEFRDLNY